MNSEIVLSARGIYKSYHKDKIEVPVLRGVDVDVSTGLVTALVGRSGSGKSTLMHLMATLDQPDRGEIYFRGERMDNASRRRRDQFRNRDIGIIFQFYHLLPELSAIENVMAPQMIGRSLWNYFCNRKEIRKRAEAMLDRVGLNHRATHKPSEMSGGEMQRAAIARALMADPSLLLADEPTGNLDTETGQEILKLLAELNQNDGLTILMITHDESIAENADVCHRMKDGQLETRGQTLQAA
ncbi:P-loop containing nucleoside triphosphate hydrolase [Rubripirellula obstinata]|uniref:P-loop containing nucleoside triphosphate hydrolase n=1 Tax=Rubripirellula obstinata TaxID=406547 RepID=A0A5B1CI69_9BACT|nr:ABC transporter ATP-binding protein [Rubripirellula obstinata]KAA1259931.1 P-loop containing nucleoside triphosphate hydrolase [Rubripirellula obstinata]